VLRARWLPGVAIFVLTSAVLLPQVARSPQHGDERMYIWKSAYYADRLTRLDFSGGDPSSYVDPGWSPFSFWAVEQPWGSHMLYALALGAFGVPAPLLPYSYDDQSFQGADTEIPAATVRIVRGMAVVCASLGLALIALRFGWPAVFAGAVFLVITHVRSDLSRAWAEGPLLRGCGLCVASFGTPWFTPFAGLAAGLKLTGLVFWPVVWFTAPIPFGRMRHIVNIFITGLAFAATTPYSWQAGGPLYLAVLLAHRIQTYAGQSRAFGGPLGLFVPTRYLWPVELLFLVGGAVILSRRIARREHNV